MVRTMCRKTNVAVFACVLIQSHFIKSEVKSDTMNEDYGKYTDLYSIVYF